MPRVLAMLLLKSYLRLKSNSWEPPGFDDWAFSLAFIIIYTNRSAFLTLTKKYFQSMLRSCKNAIFALLVSPRQSLVTR
jgi:hypothetical protein